MKNPVTVKAAPRFERVRRTDAPGRFITDKPEVVERTFHIERMLLAGVLVTTDEEPVAADPRRVEQVMTTEQAKADFQQKVRDR